MFVDPALNKNGVGFGKKCEWIVAKTSAETLASALGITGTTMTWREALARAGAGHIGNYDSCAFEGEGQVYWFEGGFSDYEENKKQRLGISEDEPRKFRYKKLVV